MQPSSSLSSVDESDQKPPIQLSSKRGRPSHTYTPGELEVLNEWDRINGLPCNRAQRDIRETAIYLAGLIEQGCMTLAYLDAAKKHIEKESFYHGKVTLKMLGDKIQPLFSTIQKSIDPSSSSQSDNIPDWMRSCMV